MSEFFKLPFIIVLSVFINALLFLLIHQLTSNDVIMLPNLENLNMVEFITFERKPDEILEKKIKPETPPEPEETPPLPELPQPEIPKPTQAKIDVPSPEINVPFAVDGIPYIGDYLKTTAGEIFTTGVPEIATDIIPTTRIEPLYPPRALRAGIEGKVTVEFTITTNGSVKNIEIINSEPPDIFDRAVLQAVKRWKFSPQIANGEPVEKRARQEIKFTLKK